MTSVRPGILLGGKYRLEEPIGKGGMGWVWRAQQIHWGAPVAVKLIQAQLSGPAEAAGTEQSNQRLRRFLVEAKTAAAIRSPHVVQILDHGVEPGLNWAYIVMELLEGETLEARLERCGRLASDETVRILSQVAKALARVHEADLVHRDLKPGNIFLVKNDGEDVVKVLDFGIAKAGPAGIEEASITSTGQQLGTPVYMSPEQIRGLPDVDFRADVWAFGVIAYECLVGARPFDGETLGDLSLKICAEPLPRPSRVASLPVEFDEWFERCVNRERRLTFGSAREAAERLEIVLGRPGRERLGVGRLHVETPPVRLAAAALGATTVATPAPEDPFSAPSPPSRFGGRWVSVAVVMSLIAIVVAVSVKSRVGPTEAARSTPSLSQGSASESSVSSGNVARVPLPPLPSEPLASIEPSPGVPVAPSRVGPESNMGTHAPMSRAATPSNSAGARARNPKRPVSRGSPNAAPAPPTQESLDALIQDRY